MLKKIENLNYNLKVWDPKLNPSDKFHKMPIITPCYPSMCATHNIINSTMKRFKEEFERSFKILDENRGWDELFKGTDFFQKYKNFLAVFIVVRKGEEENANGGMSIDTNISGGNKNAKDDNIVVDEKECLSEFKTWMGHVKSRIRFLSTKLETIEQLDSAPSFPEIFEIRRELFGKGCESELKKGQQSKNDSELKQRSAQENKPQLKKELSELNLDFTFCSVIFVALDMVDSKQLLRKRIFVDAPIAEFKEMAFDWEKKTSDMDIVVKVMKRKNVNLLLKEIHENRSGC